MLRIALFFPVAFALEGWQQEVLDRHNVYRCMHGVPLMTWDYSIEASAQNWANYLAGNLLGHSDGNCYNCPVSHVGENIAWGPSAPDSVTNWYNEIEQTNGGWISSFSSGTGHYTQVVWKDSTMLGCGWYNGGGGQYGRNLVCQYGPAGNFPGAFDSNVNAPRNSEGSCQGGAAPTPVPPPTDSGTHTNEGCLCYQSWTETSTGGQCSDYCCNPDNDPNGNWCFVVDAACQGANYGYCPGGGTPSLVSCGAHQAGNCADCVWENGQNMGSGWCNGECQWNGNGCVNGFGSNASNLSPVLTKSKPVAV